VTKEIKETDRTMLYCCYTFEY